MFHVRKLLFPSLTLVVFAGAICSGQQETLRRPRLGNPGGGQTGTYRKAILDGDKGTLTCKDPGESCKIVDRIFVSPSQPIPDHDAGLQELTQQINRILSEIRSNNRDPERELAVVLTPYAPLLAWCRNSAVVTKPVDMDGAPERFYEILAISASVARLQAGQGGETRSWTFTGPGGFVCYPSKRSKQFTSLFLEAARTTPAHDEVLQSATRTINQLLRQAAQRPGPRGKELSILVTPAGLLLAWSRNEGRSYVPPAEAITWESPETVIRKALSLPQQ